MKGAAYREPGVLQLLHALVLWHVSSASCKCRASEKGEAVYMQAHTHAPTVP